MIDDQLLALARKTLNRSGYSALTYRQWKDGIDVDFPCQELRDFADAVTAPFRAELAAAHRAHVAELTRLERDLAAAKADAERLREALKHQRLALTIVRDRQGGHASAADIGIGIAAIDAAIAGEGKHKTGCAMLEGTHEACCDCDATIGEGK